MPSPLSILATVAPRPFLALVGRPNVGKSTLFNRLIGARKAVVAPARGTTRDWLCGRTDWRGRSWTVMDTAGFQLEPAGSRLAQAVQSQLRGALKGADAFLLLCDAGDGLLPVDEMIASQLRRSGKPVMLAVNKVDHGLSVPAEFFSLGIAEPFPISALHGRGIQPLLDAMVERLTIPPEPSPEPVERPVALAIVGRQNVGKSSLLNALLRQERAVVSEVPGTTRDAVDTVVSVQGQPVVLVDTAGLRHRRKVKDPVDLFSMTRSLAALRRCDVALVMLDATQGVTRDDRRLLTRVCESGCGVVILVNKWDLVKAGRAEGVPATVRRVVPFMGFAPALAVSAKTGFQVTRGLTTAVRVAKTMRHGWSDADCFSLLQAAWRSQPPPRMRGRTIHLLAARWHVGRPFRVEVITKPTGKLPTPYQHYLLKRLHAHPQLAGIPVALS